MQKWRAKEDTQGENEKEKGVEVLGERVKGCGVVVWAGRKHTLFSSEGNLRR